MKVEEYRALTAPKKKKVGHPEEDLQIACVGWFRLQFPQYEKLLFANLNSLAYTGDNSPEGRGRYFAKLKRLKAMGLEPGVPDLTLAVRRGSYSGFFCELKVPEKYPEPHQREMMGLLEAQGFYCVVAKTTDEFAYKVKRYMSLETPGRIVHGG